MLRSFSTLPLFSALVLIGCGGSTPPATGPVKPAAATMIYAAQQNVFAGVATPDLTAHDLIVKVPANATGVTHDTYISGPAGVSMSAIAANANGNVYIAALDANTNTGEVLVYSKDAVDGNPPLRVIRGDNTTLSVPLAIATDREGNIYVFNLGTKLEVVEFAAGASGDAVPLRRITDIDGSWSFGSSIAVNSKGEIFVSNALGTPEISVFSAVQNGAVAPVRIVSGPHTALSISNSSITVDADDNLFVTSFGSLDGKSSGLILQFAADVSGDATPVRTISGASAGRNMGFSGIAVDGIGTIFVQEELPDGAAMLISYDASATGIAPVRTAPINTHLSRGAKGLIVF